jgi:hypothetical protein
MIGVGKREDLIKDFERTEKQGPWPYIIVGLIMTVGFIGAVIVVVYIYNRGLLSSTYISEGCCRLHI